MAKKPHYKRTGEKRRIYFKEWRKFRSLTQEQVAERIGTTKTRVTLKERQLEPYDEAYLEALAEALTTDPASLLMRNPLDGEGIWSIWERAKPGEREQIERVVKAMVLKKTG